MLMLRQLSFLMCARPATGAGRADVACTPPGLVPRPCVRCVCSLPSPIMVVIVSLEFSVQSLSFTKSVRLLRS